MADNDAIGIDLDCLSDFTPHMATVSGRRALAQALGRRLTCPRGRMPWWPNYGTDLRQFLLSKASPSVVAVAAQKECAKDERVLDVTAPADLLDREIRLRISVTDDDGPFEFTLSITEAKAAILELIEQ